MKFIALIDSYFSSSLFRLSWLAMLFLIGVLMSFPLVGFSINVNADGLFGWCH